MRTEIVNGKKQLRLTQADLDLINFGIETIKNDKEIKRVGTIAAEGSVFIQGTGIGQSIEVDMVDVLVKSVVDLINQVLSSGASRVAQLNAALIKDGSKYSLQQLIDAHEKLTKQFDKQQKAH